VIQDREEKEDVRKEREGFEKQESEIKQLETNDQERDHKATDEKLIKEHYKKKKWIID